MNHEETDDLEYRKIIDAKDAEIAGLKSYLNAWSNGWDEAIDEKDRCIKDMAAILERWAGPPDTGGVLCEESRKVILEADKVLGPKEKPNEQ